MANSESERRLQTRQHVVVNNPVAIIQKARQRLAGLAAVETALCAVLPIGLTFALAFTLGLINIFVFERLDYVIQPQNAARFQDALLAFGLFELLVILLAARRSWNRTNDFVRTAERIDQQIGGRQEIVTLAAMADPARPETTRLRSALFPILWRRALSYLERFDARNAFRLELLRAVRRSAILCAATILILGGATVALMERPTPEQTAAHRLQQLAKLLARSEANPSLAVAARDVARDLISPKLPPEQKLAELQALQRELQKHSMLAQMERAGKGNSSGGNGSGSSGGSGQGAGSAAGSAPNNAGKGSGHSGQGNQQLAELRNGLSKAQMKFEEEVSSAGSRRENNGGKQSNGAGPQNSAEANKPGGQKPGGAAANKRLAATAALAASQAPSGANPADKKNQGGSAGDTHLGEFPKAVGYERYYKLGQNGAPINLRDARYVTFRLPSEVALNGRGALVADAAHPTASTPYTNAPLKQVKLPVTPDEQQLVPPRYRELIR